MFEFVKIHKHHTFKIKVINRVGRSINVYNANIGRLLHPDNAFFPNNDIPPIFFF